MPGYKWRPEEDAIIDEIAGTVASKNFYRTFNSKSKKILGDKHIKRTHKAIISRIYRTAGSIKPINRNFNLREFAKIIGFKYNRVYSWRRRNCIKTRRNGDHHIISRDELDRFAKNHPGLLSEAKELFLLEIYSKKQVQYIKSHQPHKNKTKKIVGPDGTIYDSMRIASRQTGIPQTTLRNKLKYRIDLWQPYDEWKLYKDTWYGIKTYKLYEVDKIDLCVKEHDTATPPIERAWVHYFVKGIVERKYRINSKHEFYYDKTTAINRLTEVKEQLQTESIAA